MSRIKMLAATALFGCLSAAAQASTFTFATLDNPADPTFNQLLGITDAGTIAGYFGSAAAGHPNTAYTIAAPYNSFVPANLPGSVQTQATGINTAGYVTGFWSDTNLGPNAQGMNQDGNFGFIHVTKPGMNFFVDVNNPAVASQPHVNQVLGINAAGIAAGFYNDANNASHSYVYAVSTGKFQILKEPGSVVSSAATGINKNNLICGFSTNQAGRTTGYLRPLSGGTPINFGVPGSMNTQFLGVDDAGEAVGFYVDANNVSHGVIYDPANGQWQPVNAPSGVNGTVLNGVNNKNQAVGFYTDAAGNVHGMLVEIMP